MKKGFIIISLLAIIVIAGVALFKTIKQKSDGKAITENDPSQVGNPTEEKSEAGSEAPGA